MSDEENKRLIKAIFGYYPVFDPKTKKKILPKTTDERVDSTFHYLDKEFRDEIKAALAEAEEFRVKRDKVTKRQSDKETKLQRDKETKRQSDKETK